MSARHSEIVFRFSIAKALIVAFGTGSRSDRLESPGDDATMANRAMAPCRAGFARREPPGP